MTADDATDLARLRGSTAHGGLIPVLGQDALRAFFTVAATDLDTFGFVVERGRTPVGYGLCTTAAPRLQRAAIRATPSVWIAGFSLAMRDRRLLRRAVRQLRAVARPAPPDLAEARLRLFDISVAEEARGLGLGRMILAALILEARARGHEAIGLSVLADNVAALRLYESAGFRPVRSGVRDDGQPFLTMRLDLVQQAP